MQHLRIYLTLKIAHTCCVHWHQICEVVMASLSEWPSKQSMNWFKNSVISDSSRRESLSLRIIWQKYVFFFLYPRPVFVYLLVVTMIWGSHKDFEPITWIYHMDAHYSLSYLNIVSICVGMAILVAEHRGTPHQPNYHRYLLFVLKQ